MNIKFFTLIDDIGRYNHVGVFAVVYADDILMLAPSVTVLQKFSWACEQELDSIHTSINVKQEGWLSPTESWDHRGKCYMERKRIQCLSKASQHVPIYLQPFPRYSGISVASDWFSTVLVSE